MTTTLTLRDGYDRTKHPKERTFRPMTPDEVRGMKYRLEIHFTGDFKTYRRCRVNGAPKTWKTRPDVELPIKYGMYECARAVSDSMSLLVGPDAGHPTYNGGEAEPVMRLPNGGILLVPVEA